MSQARPISIDPLSAQSLLLRLRSAGVVVGTATGFLAEMSGEVYLVTNWHVVTGRSSFLGTPLLTGGVLPDAIDIVHHSATGLGNWIVSTEDLFGQGGIPRWIEHPLGRFVDVVVLPIHTSSSVKLYPLDLGLADTNMVVSPAMPVSIVGFPYGLSTGGIWPIWKTGHIASDPDLDFDYKPAFLIDATAREGMSGSPVYVRLSGGFAMRGGGFMIAGGPSTRFVGIYSAQNLDAELGLVWRPQVLEEIASMLAQQAQPSNLQTRQRLGNVPSQIVIP